MKIKLISRSSYQVWLTTFSKATSEFLTHFNISSEEHSDLKMDNRTIEELRTLKEKQNQRDNRIKQLESKFEENQLKHEISYKQAKLELLKANKRLDTLCNMVSTVLQDIRNIKTLSNTENSIDGNGKLSTATANSCDGSTSDSVIPLVEPVNEMEVDNYVKYNSLCMIDLCNHFGIQEECDGNRKQLVCSSHHTRCHTTNLKLRHPYGYSKFAALYQVHRNVGLFSDPKVPRKLFEAILNDNELFSEDAPPCE